MAHIVTFIYKIKQASVCDKKNDTKCVMSCILRVKRIQQTTGFKYEILV